MDYAERLRGFRAVELEIEWKYRRLAGGWRSLLPMRGETAEGTAKVTIAGDEWRDHCRRAWHDYPPPLNVLEGREPDHPS